MTFRQLSDEYVNIRGARIVFDISDNNTKYIQDISYESPFPKINQVYITITLWDNSEVDCYYCIGSVSRTSFKMFLTIADKHSTTANALGFSYVAIQI